MTQEFLNSCIKNKNKNNSGVYIMKNRFLIVQEFLWKNKAFIRFTSKKVLYYSQNVS